MTKSKQVFQTNSPWRWRTFTWISRLVLVFFVLMIPLVVWTLARGIKPGLPVFGSTTKIRVAHPEQPAPLSRREAKKYQGFDAFLKMREKLQTVNHAGNWHGGPLRAAFYVDWDPQSYYSLQQHVGSLDMVLPEWFFIDPATDSLLTRIDTTALHLLQDNHVQVVPMLSNVNTVTTDGAFDGKLLHDILVSPAKRERLISAVVRTLQQNHLQGVNVDFEDPVEKTDEPLVAFQQEIYNRLHPLGLLVTQDIIPANEDFNIEQLADHNDYIFLMAYDEHYATSVPGPVSSQRWIEKILDESAAKIPSSKIVLCIAGYGYDWPEGDKAETLSYDEAIALAKQYNAPVDFDNNSYNNHFTYTDADSTRHDVYFTDAATNFNTLRFADEYGTGGTALWRLGSEDPRTWQFYHDKLDNRSFRKVSFDFSALQRTAPSREKPDYVGDGEILNVMTEPAEGRIALTIDTAEGVIAEEKYDKLPTRYVIRRYGVVQHQVVLTFDDGPDAVYTPAILDILQKEKVPAAFFVVGMEAESNLPLLKRIIREGHEIGNHTFTHPNMATVSAKRAATEMEATRLLIESVTGRSTILFRAPFNADAEPSTAVELKPVALSRQENYYTVGESIDPNDWETGITADSVFNRVIRQYNANPEKGIILLHDAGGNRKATVAALPRIIHYFKERGIGFTTIAQLLHTDKATIMPVVHNGLITANGQVASIGYWIGKFAGFAFWLAILLGLGRILLMAVMAIIQRWKDKRPTEPAPGPWPFVSIIVPAYNEELTAAATIRHLLEQDYPAFEIVFVNDGSTDQTYQNVSTAFGQEPRVRILTKLNGGKAAALNEGIAAARGQVLVCIDADTRLLPDAVSKLVKRMLTTPPDGKRIGAVAGNVKVGNERNLLTKWQSIEYTTAQNFDRRAFDLVNGITVVPGAIGAFRKEAIAAAGGFTSDTLAEDCDLTIRIIRAGFRVVNCTDAIALTEAPETLRQFMKQRFRWSFGVMQAFWKNRDACFNYRYGGLGLVALPNILLFQVLLPLLAPMADLMLLFGLLWNRHNPASMEKIAAYYGVFLLVDLLVSLVAFLFEKEKLHKLVWLLPQRFAYRQLMYVVLYKAIRKAIKGESQGWGILRRTGNATGMKPGIA